jgi:GH25 family lysozyme M1 (1,4-beta-N-acetylmuramidase)
MAGLAAAVAVHTAVQEPAANAAVTAPPAQGTDVSNLTTVTSWASVKAAGITFTGVMAFDGASVSNPSYNTQVTGALAQGLFVMPYVVADPLRIAGDKQFAKAWPVIDGIASARYAGGGQYLPVALDMEAQPQVTSDACYGLSKAQMVAWIQAFLTAARQQIGTMPVVYSSPNWWQACTGGSTAFGGYPLWIADYGVSAPVIPPGWSGYTFWQSSGSATLNGISGAGQADLDQLGGGFVTAKAGTSGSFQVHTLSSLAGQPVTYAAASTLPPGVSVSASGKLSWTPATPAGALPVTIGAGGAVPSAVSVTLLVHAPIAIATANRSSAAGNAVSLHVTASGPDKNAGFAATLRAAGLPPGLTMNSAGLITGWLVKPGSYTVKVTAADTLGGTGSASFTWAVKAAAASGTAGAIRQIGGSAKCLDDPSGKTANKTPVDLSSCTGKANQNWTVVPDGTVRTGGKCLDVVGGATANGAKLQLYSCNSADLGQVWQAGSNGQLVNLKSKKCLDVPVASAANGTRPVIEPCANSATQPNEHWLRPAAPLVSGTPGKCAAVSGAAAVLAGCANTTAQHWQSQPDGTVRAAGKCLTAGAPAGGAVTVAACSGAAATKWQLISKNPVAVQVANGGLCVTVPAVGSQLVMEPCVNNATDTWQLR